MAANRKKESLIEKRRKELTAGSQGLDDNNNAQEERGVKRADNKLMAGKAQAAANTVKRAATMVAEEKPPVIYGRFSKAHSGSKRIRKQERILFFYTFYRYVGNIAKIMLLSISF